MPPLVLVVDDSSVVRELAVRSLRAEGFAVDEAQDLASARRRLEVVVPDAVVLDVELPDGSGFDLLREILDRSPVPVIMLTARESEDDRVLGLELGADDYLVKPFFPRELAARVRKVVGRDRGPSSGRLEFAGLVIDVSTREVHLPDGAVTLTSLEFELLAHLAASPRRVFGRDELLRDVWRSNVEWQSARTVTEHVRRIRQKIEVDPSRPRWIHTVGSAGYRFEP